MSRKKFQHPELKEGEMFLINAGEEFYKELPWKTKRKGNKMFTVFGDPVENKTDFPIFINKSECESAGIYSDL
ncbi:hypothetical protein L6278_00940 [Candidatus Parcubacteria bacterium]|nr:hypothetical protein [Patescibacteria group bacterium]MCG2686685.1 hypothetical protein [Candidatus Parcubacteria bacterium]